MKDALKEGGFAEVDPNYRSFVGRISAARKPVFSIGTLAMVVIMAAAILGAGVDTGALPTIVHAWLAYGGIVCNLAAAKIELTRSTNPGALSGSEPASELVTPLVELSSVIKTIRVCVLFAWPRSRSGAHDRVALTGIDQVAAQVLADLITGATLPDTGTITVFGRPTSSLADGADWLSLIERIGIVSERAVLLDALTVIQNLAMPFSLDIEPPPPELRERAAALAAEVGLADGTWDQPVASLDAAGHLRVRVGRALALDPALLLWEHPSAALPRDQVIPAATAMRKVLQARNVASLSLTADLEYASAAADTVWTLDAATGRVHAGRRGWFGRRHRTL